MVKAGWLIVVTNQIAMLGMLVRNTFYSKTQLTIKQTLDR